MLIISQKRNTLINFERINFLKLEEVKNSQVNIIINYADDKEGIIATYNVI